MHALCVARVLACRAMYALYVTRVLACWALYALCVAKKFSNIRTVHSKRVQQYAHTVTWQHKMCTTWVGCAALCGELVSCCRGKFCCSDWTSFASSVRSGIRAWALITPIVTFVPALVGRSRGWQEWWCVMRGATSLGNMKVSLECLQRTK